MTAEEFEGNILNDKGETAIERYLMDRYEFAEAYHKHEVETIINKLQHEIKGFADMGEMTVNTEISLLLKLKQLLKQ